MMITRSKRVMLEEITKANGGAIEIDKLTESLGINVPLIAAAAAVLMVVSHIVSYMCTKKLLEKKVC